MATQSNLDDTKGNNRTVSGKKPDNAPATGNIDLANAAGDIAGTTALPTVIAVHLSDGTRLAIDGIGNGQFFRRVGAQVQGATLGSAAFSDNSAFDAAGLAASLSASAQAFAIQRGNHTGTQAASTITGLASVATSGAYADLTGKPTLGTSAAESGLSVTITTAKLTTLGTNGSMTFTNGVLTSQTAAT